MPKTKSEKNSTVVTVREIMEARTGIIRILNHDGFKAAQSLEYANLMENVIEHIKYFETNYLIVDASSIDREEMESYLNTSVTINKIPFSAVLSINIPIGEMLALKKFVSM